MTAFLKPESNSNSAWNTRVSIIVDWVFGVLPALAFGLLSLYGIAVTVYLFVMSQVNQGRNPSDFNFVIAIFILSLSGLLGCFSLILVTIKRSSITRRPFHIAGLLFGIAAAAIILYWVMTAQPFASDPSYYFLTAAVVSIALVAIKHIVMLARA